VNTTDSPPAADAGITDPQKWPPHANITARQPSVPAGKEHVDMPREKENSAKKNWPGLNHS
jgi:hypothetical protein